MVFLSSMGGSIQWRKKGLIQSLPFSKENNFFSQISIKFFHQFYLTNITLNFFPCGAFGTEVFTVSSAVIHFPPPIKSGSVLTHIRYTNSANDYLSSSFNCLYSQSKYIHSSTPFSDFELANDSFLQLKPLNEYPIPKEISSIQSNKSTAQQLLDLRYSQKCGLLSEDFFQFIIIRLNVIPSKFVFNSLISNLSSVWISNRSIFKNSVEFYIEAYSKMLFFEEAIEQLQMREFDLKELTLERIEGNIFYFMIMVISFSLLFC